MKNLNNRKVVIIGDGMVGSSIAYTFLLKSNIQDIVIIDVNKDKAEGDALDMNHAMSLLSPKDIKAGSYSDIEDAHIIVITAGAAQKPGETRLQLCDKNKAIFDSIFAMMKPHLNPESIVLIVTNPVDILTYYAYTKLGLPANQVIGSGTVLDTARLKFLLSQDTKIDPRNIHTYVIGEHGDSEVMAYSVTFIAGVPIFDFCNVCGRCKNQQHLIRLEEMGKEVVTSAYKIIEKKGSTYYGIASAVARIVDAIVNDTESVLTVSSYVKEALDGQIKDVYLSVPSIVNQHGAIKTLWPAYNEIEAEKLINSAQTLKKYY